MLGVLVSRLGTAATAASHVWRVVREPRAFLIPAIGTALWLRACNQVGSKTRTFGRPHVENRGRIVIGNRVRLKSTWVPVELVTGPDGVIEISDGVFINYGTLISAHARVRIGKNVMVGNYAIIADTEIPGIGDPPGAPRAEARAVDIGDGAWLAARVTVLPGSRIGAGAVVAAGSVVAGEIPAGAVAGGIPARVLRPAANASVPPEPQLVVESPQRRHA